MKTHSIKYNFIMNFILKIASFIFPLITYPYASRVLLPEGIGKVSFATSVIACFSMFAMMGISTYGVRACAQVREDKEALSKLVHELMLLTSATSLCTYVVLGFSLVFVDKFHQNVVLIVICSAQILLNVIGVEWLYSALEEYSYITMVSVAFKFLGMLLLFLFVKDEGDFVIYGAITVIASYGSYVLNFIRLRKMIYFKRYKYKVFQHFKPLLLFFVMSIAISIYTNLDSAMLGFLKDDFSVGVYATATKIRTILSTIVASLGTVLLPRLSYYYERNMKKEFHDVVKKSLNFTVLFSIPMILFFGKYAYECIVILSGKEYVGAVAPMIVLLPAVFFSAIANLTGLQILIPMNREKVYLAGVLCGAGVDFVLNLILIPKIGATGAAIGTLVAEMVGVLIQVIYLRKFLAKCMDWKNILHVAIASAGAFAFVWALDGVLSVSNPFVILLIGGVGFFGVYGGVLLLQKNEMAYMIMEQVLGMMRIGKKK